MCCLQQLTVLGVYNRGGAAYKAYMYMQYWITYIVLPKAFHGGSAITQEMIEPNHRNTDKWMAYIFRLLFLKYIKILTHQKVHAFDILSFVLAVS